VSTAADQRILGASTVVSGPPRSYPSWPLVALFGLTPVWWALGLLDVILLPLAVVMALLLAGPGRVRAPRGFGVWLLFVSCMLASVVMVDTPNHLVAFAYRAGIYLGRSCSCTSTTTRAPTSCAGSPGS
jgi:hypothetical protein